MRKGILIDKNKGKEEEKKKEKEKKPNPWSAGIKLCFEPLFSCHFCCFFFSFSFLFLFVFLCFLFSMFEFKKNFCGLT